MLARTASGRWADPKGRLEAAREPLGRSGSGGPERHADLKRSDREETGAAGRGNQCAAMVSRAAARPRSNAHGAGKAVMRYREKIAFIEVRAGTSTERLRPSVLSVAASICQKRQAKG